MRKKNRVGRNFVDKYRTYVENSPVAFFIINPESKYVKVNDAACRLLGYSKEELLEKTASNLVFEEDLPLARKHHSKLKETGKSVTEFRLKRKDGQPVYVILNATQLPDGNLMAFCENITERKKAEEALWESEVRYEQLVDRLPEMVFEIDLTGHIAFANLRAVELLGYSKDELEANFDANRLVAPEDVLRSRENMRLMFAKGLRQSYEYVFVRKNGERFPVLLNSEPIIKNDKIVGARGIVVDITERKDMEKRLQEQERLAAIGTTAGMVGHDIRNPLQAMTGDVYLARAELVHTPQSKERKNALENLQEIEKSIDYINKIVADLQDFARAIYPVGKETDLVRLFKEILLKSNLPDSIKVFCKVDKDAKRAFVDPELLKRVLSNLVLNAVQAMPEGGELSVSAFIKDEGFVIEVKDTGVGIPEDVKAKIFTPMFTTKSKGQGLGLAVVKRLTEAMNGTVAFESEQGKGTKFIVRLPNKEPDGKLVHK